MADAFNEVLHGPERVEQEREVLKEKRAEACRLHCCAVSPEPFGTHIAFTPLLAGSRGAGERV